MSETRWTLLGVRPIPPSPSWTYVVIAFVLAAETFLQVQATYPWYMSLVVLAAGGWAGYKAIEAKSLFGLAVFPVSLLWLNPLTGGEWFLSLNATMFLAHAVMALLFALVAYTYLARVKKPK